jgi:hypothetical protein
MLRIYRTVLDPPGTFSSAEQRNEPRADGPPEKAVFHPTTDRLDAPSPVFYGSRNDFKTFLSGVLARGPQSFHSARGVDVKLVAKPLWRGYDPK